MFKSKFTKFLPALKQQISFSSNFASLCSIMRHNSSILFFSRYVIYFQKKEPIKVQIWWNFTWAVESEQSKEILCFDGLILSKSCKVAAKKVQKSYFSWHRRVTQSLKKNVLAVSDMTWGICLIFTKPFKSLKISFWWALFVQSIKVLCHKNTGELPIMTLNSYAKCK